MNKQSITFSASEQTLEKLTGDAQFASNTVSYVEATFTLGTNWAGFDSVRAVWKSQYYEISMVLDQYGKCDVPAEVMYYKSKVFVNLVGVSVSGDEITDRLTTYPTLAFTIDSDSAVEGTETTDITPSQFDQFVSQVSDDAAAAAASAAEAEAAAASLTVDSALSTSSTNPVQNKVITGAVNDLKEDIDAVFPNALVKKLYTNKNAISVTTGAGSVEMLSRLHTALVLGHIGDVIKVPSGLEFWVAYYDIDNGYYDNSYNVDGWVSGKYALKHDGFFSINIKKTDGTDFTENECHLLSEEIQLYSSSRKEVCGILFDVGNIMVNDDSSYWVLNGDDYYYSSWNNQKTLNTTRWRTANKIKFNKNGSITVAEGYRFYLIIFQNGTVNPLGWKTGTYKFTTEVEARVVLDVVSETKKPYTQWDDLSDIVNIIDDVNMINATERIDAIEKSLSNNSLTELYVGDLVNGHLVASGVVDDNYTDYRLSTREVVALPCGSKRKIKVNINDGYLFAIRTGATSVNLNNNLYWYKNGDIVTVPNGDNYYAISICNASGNETHIAVEISPSEIGEIGLSLLYEDTFNILDSNDEPSKVLSNARLFFSNSELNTMNKYAVIGHTSDCHGDYKRVDNFLKFCDNCMADVACVTGDIVSYTPSQEIKWFNDLLLAHDTLPAVCTGNHDVYDDSLTDEDIYDFMFADVATKLGNTTGETWYYKDIASKKLRLISVNLYQYGGESRWYTHFTDEQLAWIVSTIASTPNDYGIIVLSHASQVNLDNAKDADYGAFFQDARLYNNTHNSVSGGVPLYDIVDAFISRTTLAKTYTQTGAPSSVSVSADFSNVDSSVEFIAHLTGHFHQDSICYVPNRTNKQLMLNVTCTNAIYGGASYPYLADIQDQARNNMDATQDAFNMYVVDRDNKTVKVVRIGNNVTYQMKDRKYMEIPYAD